MNENSLTILFDKKDGYKNLDIQKWQVIENFFDLITQVFWLVISFKFFNWFANFLIIHNILSGKEFNTDILYSVFVIPVFWALKEHVNFFDALFAQVYINDNDITVRRGWFYKKYDKLYLKDLNNIELYRPLMGKIFGYSHINLYAIGGQASIPYLKNTKNNFSIIQEIIEETKKKQSGDNE